MKRSVALITTFLLVTALVAEPARKSDPIQFVSLKGFTNVKHDENLHSNNFPNNNLKSLPTGKQKLGDFTFEIGEGVLQLGSANVEGKPNKIEGIKVGATAKKLHFLQACGYNAEEGTVIGKYVIRYEDKTTADVEITFGKDVVDWWAYPDRKGPTHGKTAWEGENEASKGFDAKIKLYVSTWENPMPAKRIVTIDFVATKPEQPAAPFCAAITIDNK